MVQETPSADRLSSRSVPPSVGNRENTWPWPPAACSVKRCIGMWQLEHSSWISALLVGWSSTSRRTEPCQYGSREELAMIEARQSNPIDASWPDGVVRLL